MLAQVKHIKFIIEACHERDLFSGQPDGNYMGHASSTWYLTHRGVPGSHDEHIITVSAGEEPEITYGVTSQFHS